MTLLYFPGSIIKGWFFLNHSYFLRRYYSNLSLICLHAVKHQLWKRERAVWLSLHWNILPPMKIYKMLVYKTRKGTGIERLKYQIYNFFCWFAIDLKDHFI